jgi:hypothetical protein
VAVLGALQGVYFLGKVLWAKGYTELLERLQEHSTATGQNVEVDVYGSGPDLPAVQQAARNSNVRLKFNGPKDHADATLQVCGAFAAVTVVPRVGHPPVDTAALCSPFRACLCHMWPVLYVLDRMCCSPPPCLSPPGLQGVYQPQPVRRGRHNHSGGTGHGQVGGVR